MKIRRDKNGIFYLNEYTGYTPPWWFTIPKDGRDAYFMLNCVTRELFKRDMLPLIKSGDCEIAKADLIKIRDFVQNPQYS